MAEPAPAAGRKYELLRHLSTGGMAEVHLARTQGIGGFERLVVIKQILPKLAVQQEFVQMFLDEARIAASLHHSNIVQVYDVGVLDQANFYAMEFLHGHDVRKMLKQTRARGFRGGIPLEHAIAVTLGVCAGLHYAHERVGQDGDPLGIVHRDVSPHNMFVTYDGCVKVIDFGIAKARNRLTQGTEHGTLKGKFGYMSPEQCVGEPLDRRSDVFAIAVVLYEMTTGDRLYTGTSDYEILKKIVEEDPMLPSARDRRYPPELERIVMKGLARDRKHRYQSALEMQLDLDQFVRDYGIVSSPTALARFMAQLFKEEISAWHDAQRAGRGLSDHVMTYPREAENDDSDAQRRPPPDALAKTDLAPNPITGEIQPPDLAPQRHTETMLPVRPPSQGAPAPRRRRGLAIVLVSGLALAGAGAAAWTLWGQELRALISPPDPQRPIEGPRTLTPPTDPVMDLGDKKGTKKGAGDKGR
jgi:serine/threonine protein kinase